MGLKAQCPTGQWATIEGPSANSYCEGDNINLTAVVSPTATPPFSYSWHIGSTSNPAVSTSSTATVNTGNHVSTFVLQVTDANGCTITTAFHNSPVGSWAILYGPSPGSYCRGENIFLQSQIPSAATPPFTYNWYINSPSSPSIGTNSTINVTADSTVQQWIFEWQDANGCEGSRTFQNEFSIGTHGYLATAHPVSCGNTATLYVYNFGWVLGNPNLGYLWSTGETTTTITATRGTTYSVTVTGTNGCTRVLTGQAQFHPQPDPSMTGSAELCAGIPGSVELIQNNPQVNYTSIEWSTGPTSGNLTNIEVPGPGVYSATVTSYPGQCTATTSIDIPETPPVPPIIDHPTILCPEVEGTATVTNASQYSEMNWFTNGTGAQISVSSNNTYLLNTTEPNGCTSEAEFSIDEFFVVPPAIAGPPQVCEFQEGVNLEVVTPYEEYLWNTGETTQSISTVNTGTYSVSTVDGNGCEGLAEIEIAPAPMPEPAFAPVPTICGGASELLEVGGGPFETYEWSNGETSETIEVSASGSYAVTVSNEEGCTADANIEISISEGPEVEVVVNENICEGSAMLTASGGASYEWSTGETTAELNVNSSGSYSVTVTDAEGCTAISSESVSLSAPPEVGVTGPASFCGGNEISLEASGSFSEYAWSNGESGTSINISQGGEYAVTATDANGCTAEALFETTLNPEPQPEITAPSGFCAGTSATLQLSNSFNEILWSNGDTGTEISVSEPGGYEVTVTNLNGCSAIESIEIEEYALPSANISGPSSFCAGSNASLSVGGGFSEISWSTGENTENITISESGSYAVTVTDLNGCVASDEMTVEAGASITPQLEMEIENCEPLATLGLGSGYAEYLWSNGETSASIDVSNEGEYTVTVSDGSGCSGNASIEVNFPTPPTVNINGPVAACDGEVVALVADLGFENYTWSTGETASEISVSTPGEYTLTATDPNGCVAETSFNFEVWTLPSANISGASTFCEGGSTELLVNGNFTEFLWSTNENTSTISVSESGEYGVTVTDVNGCTATDLLSVETGTSLELEIGLEMGNCAQDAELSVSGNFTEIAWSNGASTETIQVDEPGQYTVTVTDASGCSGEALTEVVFNDLPQVNLFGALAACEGETVALSADGGFSEYQWSTGETTSEINISQPGEYNIVVTDANGCTAEASHVFEFLAVPNAELNGPASICTGSIAEFMVSGDFAEITWNTGENTPSISVDEAGEYLATVTSTDGCVLELSQTLEVGDELSPLISSNIEACVAAATLDAGNGYENYLWSNGETSQFIDVLDEGEYTVTVSDATGCTGVDLISIELPEVPTVEILGAASLCEGYEAMLSASADFMEFEWNTGETSSEITVSAGGNYSLVATDAEGCTATAEWTVNELSTIHTELQLESCHAQDTGIVILALTSQTGCDSMVTMVTSLVPAITTQLTMNACMGEMVEYAGETMEIGDEAEFIYSSFAGCDSIVMVSVAEWPNMSFEMEAMASCWNTESGSLDLNLISGDGPFLYSVNGGAFQGEASFEALPTGEHTLTVEDAHGCLVEELFEIGEIEPTEISINDGLIRCDDGMAVLYPELISGNPDLIEWRWSTGETSIEMETNQPGQYELTVIDACEEQVFQVNVERAQDDYSGFFYVPNSFSPNGDDANDEFRVYTGTQTQIRSFDFQVFDRWGNRMFNTTNINEGWDGHFTGERKQMDVFVWFLKATVEGCRGEDVEVFREGGVHLMK